MRRCLAFMIVLFVLVCGFAPAKAATIDFGGGNHNMGTLSVGQEGTIDVFRLGFALGEVHGYLPSQSKLTIEYTITGNPVHSPSFGPFARLTAGASYNFTEGGNIYYGFSLAQDPPLGNLTRGWVHSGGSTTNSIPLVLATAGVTDSKHGIITITNSAPDKAFFMSFIEAFFRFGHVIGHYAVSSLVVVDPVSTVPLPASVVQLFTAIAGMFGFAALRRRRKAVPHIV